MNDYQKQLAAATMFDGFVENVSWLARCIFRIGLIVSIGIALFIAYGFWFAGERNNAFDMRRLDVLMETTFTPDYLGTYQYYEDRNNWYAENCPNGVLLYIGRRCSTSTDPSFEEYLADRYKIGIN